MKEGSSIGTSFDEIIDRHGTGAAKWDAVDRRFGGEGLWPMWVADMDFASPQPVIDALTARAAHGVYGYTTRPDGLYDAVRRWMAERHGWSVEREWMTLSPGVVPGIAFALNALTDVGDGIIIQPPVYHPFARIIAANGRRVVENPLVEEGGRYMMDVDDLRERAKEATMLILCSPHNPVGRVWTLEELQTVGAIAEENGLVVISDEIHSDLVFKGHVHTPYASVSEAMAAHAVVATAPSKTWNLAGLHTSVITIPDRSLRERYRRFVDRLHVEPSGIFGLRAMEAAYRDGGPWLDALMDYLGQNLDHLFDALGRRLPGIRARRPEATYLVWLDCRGLGLEPRALATFLREEARVALNDGTMFGTGGAGFERMNIACPRRHLDEGIDRIARAAERLRPS